jgi:phage shock protein PspC (stress-responsive transcriptional regulator)
MQKVVSISLNGVAYQLEEPGYNDLRVYLERAEARLRDSPDRAEVMADLEQAIGEKCARALGPHKTVVSGAEIDKILAEMGPVESAEEQPADAAFEGSGATAHAAAPPLPPRKRLYNIREGAMWCGVCNGIAAYLNVDVTWVRIAFVILTFVTSGFMLVVYFGLVFIVPYANTSEERAAAFGAPFSTEEFISRAKKKFEDSGQSERWRREWRRQQRHWNRQFQQMNEQMRSAAANAAPYVAQTGRALSVIFVPIAAIIGALLFVGFILALISLIAQHTIFGWELPYAIPLWVAVVALVAIYAMSATVVRLLRFGGSSAAAHHPGWSALHTVVWICCTLLLFWLAYTFFPGVREIVDQLMWAANLTLENLSETIVVNDFSLKDLV